MKIGKMFEKLNRAPEEPKLFVGPPGIGKTQIIYQWANSIGRRLYMLPLAHFEPEDIKGLPWVNPTTGQLEIKRGSVIPDSEERAVLFLDELTTVPPSKIAVALKIIDERKVGHFQFPKSFVVCAGNPPGFGGYALDSRIISRVVVYNVEPDVEALSNYFMNKYPASEVAMKVVGFLNFQPKHILGQFREGPFPTPRTWEKVIRLDSLAFEDVAGSVGEGIATELIKFTELQGVGEIVDKILNTKAELPDQQIKKQDISWAIASSLAYKVESSKQLYRAIQFIKSSLVGSSIDLLVFVLKAAVLKGIPLPEQEWVSDEEWGRIVKALKMTLTK